jgi:hypothetical protein
MSMTEEQRKEDAALFTEAIRIFNASAKSPLVNNAKNHEFARLKAAQAYPILQPTRPYAADIYGVVFFKHQAEMEHEAPVVIKQPERDRSGDYYQNKLHAANNSNGITANDLDSIVARKNAEKELFQLRQEERISILSPEKKARIDELIGALSNRGLAPVQKSEMVLLDINTPTQDLKNASAAQIRELLARRKKQAWVQP